MTRPLPRTVKFLFYKPGNARFSTVRCGLFCSRSCVRTAGQWAAGVGLSSILVSLPAQILGQIHGFKHSGPAYSLATGVSKSTKRPGWLRTAHLTHLRNCLPRTRQASTSALRRFVKLVYSTAVPGLGFDLRALQNRFWGQVSASKKAPHLFEMFWRPANSALNSAMCCGVQG